MIKIFQVDNDKHSILRNKAAAVPVAEIGSARIQKIIADMKTAMDSQDDAVAIAAPQIGHSLAIFVVSGKVFMPPEDEQAGEVKKKAPIPPHLVIINPVIKKLSRKSSSMEEGCLSVRWLYGKVKRAEKATIAGYD